MDFPQQLTHLRGRRAIPDLAKVEARQGAAFLLGWLVALHVQNTVYTYSILAYWHDARRGAVTGSGSARGDGADGLRQASGEAHSGLAAPPFGAGTAPAARPPARAVMTPPRLPA
ncbi:hypothetical protein DBB29_02940 [Pandoraea cepalis]|uniref:Uncharacterized protein n=1 Tax=Pandoraea cepalis TaxID=2508294 RepID=A0AAW7MJ16_9BURK|nr:hypothetical protein [Pandoraea cepalis]MDN4577076.1 hypothetical protein [Pandoraea cepalis]